jgi:hypothetical protein
VRFFVLISAMILTSQAVAAEQIVLLPVVASGERADWRSAGTVEGQLNERYGKEAVVVSSSQASKLNSKLGGDVIACRAQASCLAAVVAKTGYAYGLFVAIAGKGKRARITVTALTSAGVVQTWTGKWREVDAQIERIMGKLIGTLVPAKEAKQTESLPMEMAVMDLANQGGFNDKEISLVQGNIMALLQQSKRFKSIVGGADLRAMMDLEQQKSALGCGDASCLAELGGALGVPYLMTMSLGRFADQRVVNITIINVDEAQVLHRVSRVFVSDRMVLAKLPSLLEEVLLGAFDEGGKTLVDDAAQVAGATQAHELISKASQTRAHHLKPLVWLGAALMAGGGLGAAMMPSVDDLERAREDYDTASASKVERRWEDFESQVSTRQTLGYMVPTLLGSGGVVALLGLLSR